MSKYKEPSSMWEKRLLAIIDEQKKDINFGGLSVSLQIKNNKVTLVTLSDVVKHFKID